MYYPEISPTAPATRDDIARAMMLQQQGPIGQQASGEIDPIFAGQLNYQGHSPQAADAVVGGPFGGRGGEDREGFGSNVADPALGSPTGSPPDPGYSNVGAFGRANDTTSPASQAAQGRDAAAMAAAASGRGGIGPISGPGFGNQSATMTHTGAVAMPGGGAILGTNAPAGWGGILAAMGTPTNAPGTPNQAYSGPLFGTPANAPVLGVWDAFAGAPITQPGTPTYVGRVTPGNYTQPAPTPTGRAPVGVPSAPPGTPPGEADPGGGGGGTGFAGFSESSPGGFVSGPGSTAGFGSGYSGSADMGNTQGALGFTAGDPSGMGHTSSTGHQGFTSSAPGFDMGGPGPGGGGAGGVGGGAGGVGDFGGGTSGAGSAAGGGTDPGGSPGGVG